MHELAALPMEPARLEPMLMPTNFSDAWWVISSIVTVILLAIVVFFLKRLVNRHDKMSESILSLLVDQRGFSTSLTDHIKNSSIHCRGTDCFAFKRRFDD